MNQTLLQITIDKDANGLNTSRLVINRQQLLILYRLYNFRFINTLQVQRLIHKKQIQQAQQRLNLLVSRGWVGKNFSKRDRLTGKYASYYLLPKGIKALRQYKSKLGFDFELNPKIVHNIYKDKTASDRFINHCIGLGDIELNLSRLYGNRLNYYSKNRLVNDYFPDPRPDAYLIISVEVNDTLKPTDHFLEYYQEITPFFVYRKRIKQYVDEYLYEKVWQEATGHERPTIHLVAETPVLQRRLHRFIKKYLNDLYLGTQARFLLTNLEELKTTTVPNIWIQVMQED